MYNGFRFSDEAEKVYNSYSIAKALFQTGYLTIKDIEDKIIYKLGYPNYEVENGLSQICE